MGTVQHWETDQPRQNKGVCVKSHVAAKGPGCSWAARMSEDRIETSLWLSCPSSCNPDSYGRESLFSSMGILHRAGQRDSNEKRPIVSDLVFHSPGKGSDFLSWRQELWLTELRGTVKRWNNLWNLLSKILEKIATTMDRVVKGTFSCRGVWARVVLPKEEVGGKSMSVLQINGSLLHNAIVVPWKLWMWPSPTWS